MTNFEIVFEKLIKLREYIEQLKKIKPDSYENYISNIIQKYAIERIIQLIVNIKYISLIFTYIEEK